MALDASIVLETLHCIREREGGFTGLLGQGSEPYIWPVLLRIDDFTLQTPSHVQVVGPGLGNARVVIKTDMQAGQTADIPASVGILRTRLESNVLFTRLILVVALWEHDGTPAAALHAGFLGFISELAVAIGNINTLLALKDADDRKDAEALEAIIKTIKSQVENRVESAIGNGLTGTQKAAIATGFLNLDDLLGNDFRSFPNALPTRITLTFGKGSLNRFEIRGRLEAREVRVDRCQAKVNAVQSAQAAVNEVNAEIAKVQDELNHASPLEKPFLISEIERLTDEDLALVLTELGEARTALLICRSRVPRSFPGEAGQET